MQSFRTEFPKVYSNSFISHRDKIFCMGSCFAESIGRMLKQRAFNVVDSPFGIVFNPLSIAQQLNRLLNQQKYLLDELIFDQGMAHSLDHHGSYSDQNHEKILTQINAELTSGHAHLKTATIGIITFGSAHFYTHLSSQRITANCHKIPSAQFNKSIASVDSIVESMLQSIRMLFEFNPNLRLIISVSPVRYLKDGFVENSRSKATLILATHKLIQALEKMEYFPSYEIFMDDLRDYRFVRKDMVHPNESAIDYIWQFFSDAYFDDQTKHINERAMQVQRLINHKSHHPGSELEKRSEDVLDQLRLKFNSDFPDLRDRIK